MSASGRILALVPDAFGGRGGIAQYNRDLLTAWAASEGSAGITVLPRHAPEPVVCPPGIVQKPPCAGRVAYVLSALLTVLREPVDVVFCGHLYAAPLALAIVRFTGAKLVLQVHGIEAWQRPNAMIRGAAEAADLILSVSRHTRGRVLSWAAIAPERVLVLPNTVGGQFTPADASALGAQFGTPGKKVLLSVGRLSAVERYKGHDRVIAALPELVRQGNDVVYVVVGEGDDIGRLQALAHSAGVVERVQFVGGVSADVLPDYYRMADLFVLPSTGEGFGIAFLEAMACGTPVLGLAVAGARDALGDGELGIATSEAELVAALAGALAAPRGDPQAIAASVRRRFGAEAFARHVANLARRLAPPRAAAAPFGISP